MNTSSQQSPVSTSTPSPSVSAPTPSPSASASACPRILIIEDDPLMAECLARACWGMTCQIFHDAISAMTVMSEEELPDLILLDVLLNGPDGFTLLNELISYPDTAAIPIVLVTSLSLSSADLAHYGVRAVLAKETMTPASIHQVVTQVLEQSQQFRHSKQLERPEHCAQPEQPKWPERPGES